jgi:hypothetical protein
VLGWQWFLSNNPGYDAIVDGLMSDTDLSILITIWQKISDILKDILIVIMK